MTTPNEAPAAKPVDDPFDELGKKRRPWWIAVVAIVVLGAIGAFVYARRHRPPPPPRFLTAAVSTGNIVETIEATGTVQPVTQVQVGSQASGRVSRLHADYNARVHAGDLLAELDPQTFQAAVSAARAALLSAQASVARARVEVQLQDRNLARATALRARNLNAQADVDAVQGARDAAHAQIAVAQAEVNRAAAQLETARTNQSYARIFAPIDGVVITRSIDVGQTVAASFQAPTLFVIANDLTRMRVIADIDEADIGKLHDGMATEARVDAFPGEVFRGTLTELRFGPTNNQGVVTYPAVIDIANPELKLRPGMTATIRITTARREHVMRAPNAALRFQPSASSTPGADAGAHGPNAPPAPEPSATPEDIDPHRGRVFVLRNGNAVPVTVRIGPSDGVYTEIEAPEIHAGVQLVTDETDEPRRPGGAPGGGRRMF